jgi:hypothetical protein
VSRHRQLWECRTVKDAPDGQLVLTVTFGKRFAQNRHNREFASHGSVNSKLARLPTSREGDQMQKKSTLLKVAIEGLLVLGFRDERKFSWLLQRQG